MAPAHARRRARGGLGRPRAPLRGRADPRRGAPGVERDQPRGRRRRSIPRPGRSACGWSTCPAHGEPPRGRERARRALHLRGRAPAAAVSAAPVAGAGLGRPPDLRRGRERGGRCSRPSSRASTRAGIDGRVLVVDDGSPDGTADLAEAVAARDPRVARAAPPGQGGHRAGLPGGLPPGARRGRGARGGDGLRLLPRPGPAARPRGGHGRRRPGARLALRPGRRRRALGTAAPGDQPRRAAGTPRRVLRRGGARPDRRLQVLPPRGARGDPARRGHAPRATASRSR